MNIFVKFDEDIIEKYRSRTPKVLIELYFEHNVEYYPQEGWLDFGFIVLEWWIISYLDLIDNVGSEKEFHFMDGPYSLNATNKGDLLYLKSEDSTIQWEIEIKDFEIALINATKFVARNFYKYDFPDLSKKLDEGVRILKR